MAFGMVCGSRRPSGWGRRGNGAMESSGTYGISVQGFSTRQYTWEQRVSSSLSECDCWDGICSWRPSGRKKEPCTADC